MPYKDPEKAKAAKKKYEKKREVRRTNWMFVFYEDSCKFWRQEFEELGIPVLISPLHDQDVWTERDEAKNPEHKTGTLKKPHRHGIIMYDPNSKASYTEVCEDLAFLNSKNIKWVKRLPSMVRYLTHEDSKDKAHYSRDGVLEFCGADYRDLVNRESDVHEEMREMRKFVNKYFVDFDQFWLWCDENNPEWSRLLDSKCYGIERFLKAKRGRLNTLGQLSFAMSMQPPIDCQDVEGWGLSTTPTPGESEPRTLNPNEKTGECDAR